MEFKLEDLLNQLEMHSSDKHAVDMHRPLNTSALFCIIVHANGAMESSDLCT